MQPLELTKIDNLKYGDRFYYANDKKKEVWEVTSTGIKIIKMKGFKRWVREVTERKKEYNLFAKKRCSLLDTPVVFLRNIFNNN